MKNLSFGIIKESVAKEFAKTLTSEDNSKLPSKFVKLVSESTILQKELDVYYNLENKHIENDLLATRYIDENISRFKEIPANHIDREHNKLKNLYKDCNLDSNRKKLYESIHNLIYQNEEVDVDLIHESFEYVLDHIKKNKKEDETEKFIIPEGVDIDMVIDRAIERFNDKYSNLLEENDFTMIKTLVIGNDKEKEKLQENLKAEVLDIIDNIQSEGIQDRIHKTVDAINKMEYDGKRVSENVIKLMELKNSII